MVPENAAPIEKRHRWRHLARAGQAVGRNCAWLGPVL